jgi:hypothetical protein
VIVSWMAAAESSEAKQPVLPVVLRSFPRSGRHQAFRLVPLEITRLPGMAAGRDTAVPGVAELSRSNIGLDGSNRFQEEGQL